MHQINAYLTFDGNCRQAMSFYQQCLELDLQVTNLPDEDGKPSSDPEARIMHSQLSRGSEALLMASDSRPGGNHTKGDNFSVAIQCSSVEEIDRIFSALSQGGKVTMPLADMFWGARFGMLTDQFGIQWMLNCQHGQGN